MTIKNFLFHRVHPERDPLWDPMSPALFEKIIAYLTKHYHLITIENWHRNQNEKFKKPLATIGFDDGFKDNLEFAAPILSKYKTPASFYVVTDCITKNEPTWTFAFDYKFSNTQKLKWDIDDSLLKPIFKVKQWNSAAERIKYASILKPELKRWSANDRTTFLNSLKEQFDDIQLPQIMMNWDEVRQLNNCGFEIGSHTVSHAVLGTINDKNDLKRELFDSKKIIEQELGKTCYTISYPVGSYNDEVKKMSQEVGYQIGLAVGQIFFDTNQNDFFEIPRTELYNEHIFKTKLRMNGLLEKIKNIIR